jgi:hypothetical protein
MHRILFRTFQPRKSQVNKIALGSFFFNKKYMFFFQICRLISSSQLPKEMSHDTKTYPISGARTVFNGTSAKTMFTAQTEFLPELTPGEILVKVNVI